MKEQIKAKAYNPVSFEVMANKILALVTDSSIEDGLKISFKLRLLPVTLNIS